MKASLIIVVTLLAIGCVAQQSPRADQPIKAGPNLELLAMLKADMPEAKITVSNREFSVVVQWRTQSEAQTCQRPLDLYLVDSRIGAFINPIQNLTLKGASRDDLAKAFRLSVVAYLDKKKIPERRVVVAREIGGIYMKDDAEQLAGGPGAEAVAEAVRKSLPNNWSLSLTTASADFKPLRGLGNPLVQLTLTDDSRSLTWPLAPGKQKEFRPVLILLVFPGSDKQRIDAAVLAEQIRSDYPPLIFAVTKEHIFVTSPGYVNQGLHTAKAEAVIDELKDALKASMEIRYHTERPTSAPPAGRGLVEP